ncbi:MAG: 2TM domain-containing protein [Flavobacteriaceae bacterium]|nr:2TM domain-containing protein [Flavobacteriaceae bacterium]MDH3795967.1 2TM domain-containing protein [Flavobacteriaceae bacterium]
MEIEQNDKYKRAKKKIEQLKGFYIHLTVYVLVNIFILINIYISTLEDNEVFWQWEHFFVCFAWGIGLAFHAINVFGFNPFIGKDWERKQIEKYMRQDEEEAKKYK